MLAASIAFVALAQAQKPADRWPAPVPRVFASADGVYGFRVVPSADAKSATGTLFTLGPDAAERVVWSQALVCLPVEAKVSSMGHVATIDVWGKKGKEHSLVLYDRAGKPVADLELKGIFETFAADRNPFFLSTAGSTHWTISLDYGFDLRTVQRMALPPTASGARFGFETPWREVVVFDPDSGKLLLRKKPELPRD